MRELLDRMDSRELSEWMAYYRLEPWGEERADYRSAMIAQTIANAFRGKDTPPYKIEQFLIVRERRPMDWREIRDTFLQAFGYNLAKRETPTNGNGRSA